MNYYHEYHAGSAADVFKHLVLFAVLQQLQMKDKPFCYIDTHAGAGEYDLTQAIAAQTQEYQSGVGKLQNKNLNNALLQKYIKLIMDQKHFPGSPSIARKCLRDHDEMILIEKAEKPFQKLKTLFYRDTQVHLHQSDGYTALKALLPPKIKRGLILIDPPYEALNEADLIISGLHNALERWATGIYLIWYPIKARQWVNRLQQQIRGTITQEILIAELCPWPDDLPVRLNGSGIIVINPPWQLDQELTTLLPELCERLKQHPAASWQVRDLKA